ncbi:MAG TPA: hypothetical protein VKT28_03615 [Puia sp.]|nr:hypothetical protein [Puia sp.]
MIKPLRKRHLQIWIALSVLLPVGIISAWLVVPQQVKDRLLQPKTTSEFPILIKNVKQRNPFIAIRSNADTSALQLEWSMRTELTYPSALIYQVSDSNKQIEDGNIIGRIDVRGTYYFALKKDSAVKDFHFIVYDIIHHKIIQRINF